MAFFSGQRIGVSSDMCINTSDLTTPNLYTVLKGVGKSFAWYSEDLPATGSTVCHYNYYVERHNPVTLFSNVPGSVNKRFADFPTDYSKLENMVCISPNMIHDMHDGSIGQGDTWLKNHLSALAEWCLANNSIFVVYFDENDFLTSDRRIPVIAVGEHVKAGFQLSHQYDHYHWTKSICSMLNAPNAWTSHLAARSNISGCWK